MRERERLVKSTRTGITIIEKSERAGSACESGSMRMRDVNGRENANGITHEWGRTSAKMEMRESEKERERAENANGREARAGGERERAGERYERGRVGERTLMRAKIET